MVTLGVKTSAYELGLGRGHNSVHNNTHEITKEAFARLNETKLYTKDCSQKRTDGGGSEKGKGEKK